MSIKEDKKTDGTFSAGEYIDKIKLLFSETFPMSAPKAFVHTYGCQQSVADGEKFKGILSVMGYTFTDAPEDADIVLYNTCAVRENAEQRVFGNIGYLKSLKEKNRDKIICVCGCMTEQKHIAEKLKKSYPYVDIILGTNAFAEFPKILFNKLICHKKYNNSSVSFSDMPITEGLPTLRENSFKAYVPIMFGCDNFCSYCIVPFVRGRERSRRSEDILNEIKNLILQGYKEFTLLGQNVNSYGKGLEENINFSALLRRINELDGDFKIRFMTSHPKDCTRELIDTIAECDKVSKHLHLPVQSGSDRILKLMNRKYDSAHYLELIDYAKSKIKDLTLTSDIIVGFPGETYEDFKETLELIKTVRYTNLFTFIYSKREGTVAAKLEDCVEYSEKSKWFTELLETQKIIGREIMDSFVGSTLKCLVDGTGKSGESALSLRSDGNITVEAKGGKELIGKYVRVKIAGSSNTVLYGEII